MSRRDRYRGSNAASEPVAAPPTLAEPTAPSEPVVEETAAETAPVAADEPIVTDAPLSPETLASAEAEADEPAAVEPEAPTAPPVVRPEARPGFTVCRVTGSDIMYCGAIIEEGTVREFDDATVLDPALASILIPV